MTSFRFIHAADLHLDSPFRGLRQIPKHLYENIRLSTFQAYEQLIDYCLEYDVDFLVISGDVFDLEDRSIKAQLYFLQGLKRLSQKGIPVFVIHGNHDPADKLRGQLEYPPSVHFFSAAEVEQRIFLKNDYQVKILGRSYPTKAFKENIIQDFQVERPTESFNIGLLHTNLDGDLLHDPYCPSHLKDLLASNIDYWALGHIHQRKVIVENAPTIVYPGNTQGRHSKETGEKGCALVEIDGKQVKRLTWLSTAKIIWQEISLDITDRNSIPKIIDDLEELLDSKEAEAKQPEIWKVILMGNTPLHNLLHQDNQGEEIIEVLNEFFARKTPWIWISELCINTKPLNSVEELLKQETFLADYLQQLQIKKEFGNFDENREMAAELFTNRAIKKHLLELDDDDWDEIYQQAVNLGINYFLDEEEIK